MKTAVEWLVEQICGDHTEQWQKEIEQSNKMFEEQIMNAHEEGFYSPPFRMSRRREAEQYYNETFKSE